MNRLSRTEPNSPVVPRRYTLTHSDFTGDLYLTIGQDYNWKQISHWYTRLMRDEVLAEWKDYKYGRVLDVHCHVSGGMILGWAGLRNAIFRRELSRAIEALRFGDLELFNANPELDNAPIQVYFHAKTQKYNLIEQWGTPADYR